VSGAATASARARRARTASARRSKARMIQTSARVRATPRAHARPRRARPVSPLPEDVSAGRVVLRTASAATRLAVDPARLVTSRPRSEPAQLWEPTPLRTPVTRVVQERERAAASAMARVRPAPTRPRRVEPRLAQTAATKQPGLATPVFATCLPRSHANTTVHPQREAARAHPDSPEQTAISAVSL
jgi:hypothetical protein